MAQASEIVVEDVTVNPATGHITLWVKTKTTDGKASWDGPLRGYGVDASVFMYHLGGDVEQLKSYVHGRHRAYMGVHLDLVDRLMKMKGTSIGPVQNLDPKKEG
jgi:hypothetical protein